jgi:hypothetical protein
VIVKDFKWMSWITWVGICDHRVLRGQEREEMWQQEQNNAEVTCSRCGWLLKLEKAKKCSP